jgi:hypothetical protein
MTLRIPVRLGRSKYRAVPTIVDNIRFASKKEAKRYSELKMLQQSGQIFGLSMQAPYPFYYPCNPGEPLGKKMFTYVADFVYLKPSGEVVIEDVKGMRTPLYKLKKKLVEAQWKFTIREV